MADYTDYSNYTQHTDYTNYPDYTNYTNYTDITNYTPNTNYTDVTNYSADTNYTAPMEDPFYSDYTDLTEPDDDLTLSLLEQQRQLLRSGFNLSFCGHIPEVGGGQSPVCQLSPVTCQSLGQKLIVGPSANMKLFFLIDQQTVILNIFYSFLKIIPISSE